MFEQAMPPDTGPTLLVNVALIIEMLLLSTDRGACRSVRLRSVKTESTMAMLACDRDMRAENGGVFSETIMTGFDLSIVTFTPVRCRVSEVDGRWERFRLARRYRFDSIAQARWSAFLGQLLPVKTT